MATNCGWAIVEAKILDVKRVRCHFKIWNFDLKLLNPKADEAMDLGKIHCLKQSQMGSQKTLVQRETK
jgi:hypothetical protein